MQFKLSASFILLSLVALGSPCPIFDDAGALAKRDCVQGCGITFDACIRNGGAVRNRRALQPARTAIVVSRVAHRAIFAENGVRHRQAAKFLMATEISELSTRLCIQIQP
ncbi:hypothetical protein C8J57DRAFT_1243998 [Mycena rebaudengoi]|nr:hypothetical protein C8J57DRAFT_1243998 [Mycena rebaudengoi]